MDDSVVIVGEGEKYKGGQMVMGKYKKNLKDMILGMLEKV